MFWRVLKPDPGLADVPSVRKQTPPRRLIVLPAVLTAAILVTSASAFSGRPPLGGNDGGSTAIADAELLASSSPVDSGGQTWAIASSVAPGYTIRRTVPEVRLQFSVADDRGRLVSDLLPGELRILDNRVAVRRIREFSRLEDLPLQIGVLLDVSDSVHKTVLREKSATQMFVQRVLRPETDRAFLMAVGSEVRLWQASTGDRVALIRALEHIQQRDYVTNLYDGLIAACRSQFSDSGEQEFAQRVLVLFSDGVDTGSLHALSDVIGVAQRNEIQLFAIAVHSHRISPSGDEVLQHLANQTGGRFYVANSEKDFPAIFAAMEQQMRTQYSVSFQPVEQTPGFHSVQLEVPGPQKLQVHARQGYYFAAP